MNGLEQMFVAFLEAYKNATPDERAKLVKFCGYITDYDYHRRQTERMSGNIVSGAMKATAERES